MYKLAIVPPEVLSEVWPLLTPWIGDALKQGLRESTMKGLFDMVEDGCAQLWVIHEEGERKGVIVTSIEEYDAFRAVVIRAAAGVNFDLWMQGPGMARFEEWAELNGAEKIVAYGRKGFARKLKALGYEDVQSIYMKDLRSLH